LGPVEKEERGAAFPAAQLLDGSARIAFGRRAEPAVENRDQQIGPVEKLVVDRSLRRLIGLGNRMLLPHERNEHDPPVGAPNAAIPGGDGLKYQIAFDIRRRRDQDIVAPDI
jgi:hypothetical protein